jgi:toxin-antitoxin system PIN domain toxin
MIAVDTNVLVYVHRSDSPFHKEADTALTRLAESGDIWAIRWPCVHEFLAIVTHPRIYDPPTPQGEAVDQVECWLDVPTLVLLGKDRSHWSHLRPILEKSGVVGPMVHDARVAALCRAQGVREIWTSDRDFSRLDGIRVRNPLQP